MERSESVLVVKGDHQAVGGGKSTIFEQLIGREVMVTVKRDRPAVNVGAVGHLAALGYTDMEGLRNADPARSVVVVLDSPEHLRNSAVEMVGACKRNGLNVLFVSPQTFEAFEGIGFPVECMRAADEAFTGTVYRDTYAICNDVVSRGKGKRARWNRQERWR